MVVLAQSSLFFLLYFFIYSCCCFFFLFSRILFTTYHFVGGHNVGLIYRFVSKNMLANEGACIFGTNCKQSLRCTQHGLQRVLIRTFIRYKMMEGIAMMAEGKLFNEIEITRKVLQMVVLEEITAFGLTSSHPPLSLLPCSPLTLTQPYIILL